MFVITEVYSEYKYLLKRGLSIHQSHPFASLARANYHHYITIYGEKISKITKLQMNISINHPSLKIILSLHPYNLN